MTYRFLPATLPTLLRAAGLTVVELPGWQTAGRPASTGNFNPVGVLWHHTGGAQDGLGYVKALLVPGRSDLPGPLCHLSIGRNGTVYVVAAGRTNHAGVAKASGSVAAGDGNALYIGIEVQNTGTEGWKPAQYNAMVATGAVLKELLGTSVQTQRGHKETSVTGKWDPGMLDMDKFRADIDAHDVAAVARKRGKKRKASQGVAVAVLTGAAAVTGHQTAGTTPKAPVTPPAVVKVVKQYPNADALAKAAAAGVKSTKPGPRHDAFVKAGKVIAPFVTK